MQKKQINVFMDTEFTGLRKNTTLISIGLITETGQYFYAELTDYDKNQLDSWLTDNVINNLLFGVPVEGQDYHFSWDKNNNVSLQGNKSIVGRYLNDWFQSLLGGPLSWVAYENETPKTINEPMLNLILDCGAYDWVLFTDIFGTAFDLPECLNPYYEEFYTHLINIGYSPKDAWDVSREKIASTKLEKIEGAVDKFLGGLKKHNALWDAYVLMVGYKLINNTGGKL